MYALRGSLELLATLYNKDIAELLQERSVQNFLAEVSMHCQEAAKNKSGPRRSG
jgi:hypothetical protein